MGFDKAAAKAALIATGYDMLDTVLVLTQSDNAKEIKVAEKNRYFVERVVSSYKEDDNYVQVLSLEGSVTKAVWNVPLDTVASWWAPVYDHETNCLVFYINYKHETDQITRTGSKVLIHKEIFFNSRAEAASNGVFMGEEEATTVQNLQQLAEHNYHYAREASGRMHRPGEEYKNTWEPEAHFIIGSDEANIREAFESKLIDIKERTTQARHHRVPDALIADFIENALKYITSVLDLSLIAARHNAPPRLRRQRSEEPLPRPSLSEVLRRRSN